MYVPLLTLKGFGVYLGVTLLHDFSAKHSHAVLCEQQPRGCCLGGHIKVCTFHLQKAMDETKDTENPHVHSLPPFWQMCDRIFS